jgi:long-subunit fatty acid transport protein
MERVFLGATLGFTSLRYKVQSRYTETLPEGSNSFLRSYSEYDDLHVSGSGMHINLGVIWWIKDWLRIGASFRGSPTLRISEGFVREVNATWTDRPATFALSPEGINQYRIRNPYRLQFGGALVHKKWGIFSADWELTDYSHMLFKTDPGLAFDLSALNTELSARLQNAWRLRAGIEKPINRFAVRSGGFYGRGGDAQSPDLFGYGISAGGGMRIGHFVLDAAWMYHHRAGQKIQLYRGPGIPISPSERTLVEQHFIATLTYRFD